jgi:NhaD family Na+/H+ antiporter
MDFTTPLILAVFILGYAAIILEHNLKVNKTAVALFTAVLLWATYFLGSSFPLNQDLETFGGHVSAVSQIIFFLMGAMTLVELIDAHKGFKIITDLIHTRSKRAMLWVIGFVAFFLSSILDNLTTTILMISLLRKLVPEWKDRFLLLCVVVVAANAGGAWTPIGDVTTTMLWINGNLSTWSVMKALFIPSLISLIIPLGIYSCSLKGKLSRSALTAAEQKPEPGARLIFWVGVGALIFVPIFKALTGLPPFMGVLIGLGAVWILTDLMHHRYEERTHLRIPYILTRIDTSGVLFFLGILLSVNALETVGLLKEVAIWLDNTVQSQVVIATLIGIFSAIIDNVPLVAAAMGMYSIQEFPMDHTLWHMIAYAAGTGGSLLLIGSAAGVALMGLEKVHFFPYLKKVTIPALIGYLAGMLVYIFLR